MSIGLDNRIRFLDPSLASQISPKTIEDINKTTQASQPQVVLENETLPVEQFLAKAEPLKTQQGPVYLSIPANGHNIIIKMDRLNRASLINALNQAKSEYDPVYVAKVMDVAAPVLNDIKQTIRYSNDAADPPLAPQPTPKFVGATPVNQPDAADVKTHELFTAAEKTVDEKIKAGQLKPEDRKNAIIDEFMHKASPKYDKSSPEKQQSIRDLLMKMDLNQLVGAEIQGNGGATAEVGLVGGGAEGHYVNSMLTSVVHLLETDRFSKSVYDNLMLLQDETKMHTDLKSQRNSLVRSVLQDIAFPAKINQHSKETCAATTAQILFAIKDPAVYIKVATDLASVDGKAGSDQSLVREPGTMADDNSGRSVSGRLLQPAFMEYANAALDYNNTTDKHSDDSSGLSAEESLRLLRYLLPAEKYTNCSIFSGNPAPTKAEVYDKIKQHVNGGSPLSVGMRWGTGGHRVLVSKIDEAKQQVHMINPWGELQTMPLDEFKDRIKSACLPESSNKQVEAITTLPPSMRKPESYQPINTDYFRTPLEQLKKDTAFKDFFTADQQVQLANIMNKHKLPTRYLDSLRQSIQAHGMTQAQATDLLKRLEPISKTEFSRTLRLVQTLFEAKTKGTTTDKMIDQILTSRPGFGLPAADFEKLLTALKSGNAADVQTLHAKSFDKLATGYSTAAFKPNKTAVERTSLLKHALEQNKRLPEPLKQFLLNNKPETTMDKNAYQSLIKAVLQHPQGNLENLLADRYLKQLDNMTQEQAVNTLSELGKAELWGAFHQIFFKISETWIASSDNVAEEVTAKLKPIINTVPKPLLHALHAQMDDMFQDTTTQQMKMLLKSGKNW